MRLHAELLMGFFALVKIHRIVVWRSKFSVIKILKTNTSIKVLIYFPSSMREREREEKYSDRKQCERHVY